MKIQVALVFIIEKYFNMTTKVRHSDTHARTHKHKHREFCSLPSSPSGFEKVPFWIAADGLLLVPVVDFFDQELQGLCVLVFHCPCDWSVLINNRMLIVYL